MKGNTSSKLLNKRFRISEYIAEYVIKSVSFISIAVIALIFIFVLKESLYIFKEPVKPAQNEVLEQETYGLADSEEHSLEKEQYSSYYGLSGAEEKISVDNLLGTDWQPVSNNPRYGLLPLFLGSFKVTLLALLFASPLAILAAIYSALFAPKGIKEIIKPVIELLAGFPSVVIGFFALVTLATFLQNIFGYQYRLNAFVGGVAMALAVIPIIYTVTEDALSAIPQSLSEASLALGANKWQTALFVIVPAATPGIFAAMILGFGRAFGETMIVLMATGNAAMFSGGIFEPVRTLSATIGAEMAEVVFGDIHYSVLFFIGVLLFIITFTLNMVAEFFVRARLMKKMRGE